MNEIKNKKLELTGKCNWHENCEIKGYLWKSDDTEDYGYLCPIHYLNSTGDELMGDLRDKMSSKKGTDEAREVVREWLLKMENEYSLYSKK